MKIIRVIDACYPVINGTTKEAFCFSNELEKRNIESPIFTSNIGAKNLPKMQRIENVLIVRFKIIFKFFRFFITPKMKRELRSQTADILHIHNYRGYHSHIAYKIAKKMKIPYVINPCGSLLGYRKYLKGIKSLPYKLYDFLTQKKVILDANKVIVESIDEFNEAVDFGVLKHKITLIPMGIDVKKYLTNRTFHEITEKQPLCLLFVGRIAKNRNLEPILKAMQNLTNVELRIVGEEVTISSMLTSGYLSDLKRYVKNHNLSEKVLFIGPKYGDKLIEEYKKADCFIYTSLSENFGQTIQEAAAANLPLICTPVGFAKEIIIPGKTGFFVDFENPNLIVDVVNKLKSIELRRTINENLKKVMQKSYDWESVIKKYIRIYTNICDVNN
ncbi:MAG: glycosyltransferase [Candidatus Lokiarchaeota archaeon]|nr:glycosyltransferase [Candidatus Harpocratesius repetitus]